MELIVVSIGKSVVISVRKKFHNCAHRDLTEPFARIETALDGAERLMNGAGRLLTIHDPKDRMAQLPANVDMAEEQLLMVQEQFDSAAAGDKVSKGTVRGVP